MLGLALLCAWLALANGSVTISASQLFAILSGDQTQTHFPVIMQLRLPRMLAGFAVGGMLALAGALMQVLLRNPLADPYILGISGGAAAAALIVMWLGLSGMVLHGAAFAGALGSMLLVFGLAHGRGQWTASRLLLTGVVVAFGWGALISFILAISPDSNLRGMLFWLMGDLGYATNPWPALAVLALGLAWALPQAHKLNILVHGEMQAAALGVEVRPLRLKVYLVASLLTAGAVTVAGSIGFLGLVVPHLLRLALGSDHRLLLPASVLLGGSLLAAADTLARTMISPQQLPVGVLTALLGVPAFLFLLQHSSRESRT